MQRSSFGKKAVAILIIFLFVLSDALPILNNISFADDEDNVKINGYFAIDGNEEKLTALVCDVNDDSITLNFDISVEDKGYLKSGTLIFDNNLNFSIKETSEIQIKDNKIKVKEISKGNRETITIPIEFERQDKFTESYLDNINKITFSGVYVDNDANEHQIEKTIELQLTWSQTIASKIEAELIKNIDYESNGQNEKIVQTKVTLFAEEEDNNLPIKNTEIRITIPEISGMTFENASVEAGNLSYTQGREDYEINFSTDNYFVEGNELVINTVNDVIGGEVFNSYGKDEYTITYTYAGTKDSDEAITSEINLYITDYSEKTEEKTTTVEYDINDSVRKSC